MKNMPAFSAIIAAIIFIFATPASAFDQCNSYPKTEEGFRSWLSSRIVQSVPVKYFELARSIKLETKPGYTSLSPVFAKPDREGRPIVTFPANFAPVVCRIAVAQYAFLENSEKDFATDVQVEAARCISAKIQSQEPAGACLVNYANDLEAHFRSEFGRLSAQLQSNAYVFANDAIEQIGKHEFAHHFLNHFERVRSGGLDRVDAEFEADFFAQLNTVQTGGLYAAMNYFFSPLAEIERRADVLKSANYESAGCRATNIEDIIGLFGVIPMVLTDAAEGENRYFSSKQPDMLLGNILQELRKQPPPAPSKDNCGRLSAQVLREAHEELIEFTAIFSQFAQVLFDDRAETKPASLGTENAKGVLELINHLQNSSRKFVHLKGLSVRALSIVIARLAHGLDAGDNSLLPVVDRAVAESADDFISSDYGRILNQHGLFVLHTQEGVEVQTRLNEAQKIFERAVTMLPNLSESWMNLAFISLARGDCGEAATFAQKSANSTEDKATRDSAEEFRNDLRQAVDAGYCSEWSKRVLGSYSK